MFHKMMHRNVVVNLSLQIGSEVRRERLLFSCDCIAKSSARINWSSMTMCLLQVSVEISVNTLEPVEEDPVMV